jgi:hypothetical protein
MSNWEMVVIGCLDPKSEVAEVSLVLAQAIEL